MQSRSVTFQVRSGLTLYFQVSGLILSKYIHGSIHALRASFSALHLAYSFSSALSSMTMESLDLFIPFPPLDALPLPVPSIPLLSASHSIQRLLHAAGPF